MENPISRTAYYTLGVRAWDAAQPQPLCGDAFAASLMSPEADQVWEQFKGFPRPNASNAARHGIIDEHLREELAKHPEALVVLLGAGFDTRPFRLAGGRWIEIDEPAIITYKETNLPAASAPNRLTRVAIEFARESLADKLASIGTHQPTHVVIEGVLMYLTQAQRGELLETLRSLFPHHTIYCDLMRKSFFERYARDVHQKIVGIGATFSDMVEDPETLFTDAGYEVLASTSIPLRSARSPDVGIPPFVVRWLLGTLRRGYAIWKFRLRDS
jgi:methyltransferase (TIGR00027 family)